MTAKTKSIVIIIGTLIVGVIIGSLATGAVFSQRVAEIQALRDENGMTRFLERVIKPKDEAQQKEIRAILKKTASQQMEIRRSIVMEHREVFQELRAELAEVLTPEQKVELREWIEQDRRRRPGWPPPEFNRREGDLRFQRMPMDSTGWKGRRWKRRFEDDAPATADSTATEQP
ncbi:MAG: hypothetical protein AB8G77_09985 [Rhodothermales bacterium]